VTVSADLPFPPMQIKSIAFPIRPLSVGPVVVDVKFWESLDVWAAPGNPVNSGLLGEATFDFGVLEPGTYFTPELSVGPIFPGRRSSLVELDYRSSAGGAPADCTAQFTGEAPSRGETRAFFFKDADGDGLFESSERYSFGVGARPPHIRLDIGGDPPT